jgi:FkbM family methyltransferase
MLIEFQNINKYGITPKGVIHVGMHKAEEYETYIASGVSSIIFIEANESLCKEAETKSMAAWIKHAAISDKKELIQFNITNNGESSSILELGDHSYIYPSIVNIESVEMMTSTLDEIFQIGEYEPIDLIDRVFPQLHRFNILNLDIQGAELKAMKGLSDWSNIEAIFTEVNYREMYKGCPLIEEIDEFLLEKRFKKVEESNTGAGWGDALYIKM